MTPRLLAHFPVLLLSSCSYHSRDEIAILQLASAGGSVCQTKGNGTVAIVSSLVMIDFDGTLD